MNYALIEYEIIMEEIAKLPRTTDTSYWVPDVLELVEDQLWDYEI
jgi:hypothetical protein